MSTREEIVSGFYDLANEDSRLKRSRHGQLEYATTMSYIHRYANHHYTSEMIIGRLFSEIPDYRVILKKRKLIINRTSKEEHLCLLHF